MKLELKIVVGYGLLLLLLGTATYVLPHRPLAGVGLINVSLQLLLALLSVLIMVNTVDRSQRMIFFFSALFFGSGLLLLLSSFAGYSFLEKSTYGPMLYHLYVNKAAVALLSSLAILSIAVDFVLRNATAVKKTALTIVLAGGLGFAFFSPFISHPFGLYREPDYVLFTAMQGAATAFRAEHGTAPTDADVVAALRRSEHQGTTLTAGSLNGRDLAGDVHRLRGYLEDGGDATLFWRPLDLALTYLHAVLLAIIVALLILFYRWNTHLGAYVDKILIMFFLLFSMEILQTAGFLLTPNGNELRVIFGIGQYFTIFCLLLMVYAYDLKLRFTLSAVGKYYEFAVRQSPENVTRWRDELDQLILRTFVKKNHGYSKLGIFTESKSNSDH